jgi:ribonuclease BN (tRNA processing enzyme)
VHNDHLQGVPFFTPAYLPGARLNIAGPDVFVPELREALERTMTPPFFSVAFQEMSAAKSFFNLREGQVLVIGNHGAGLRPAGELANEDPDAVRVSVLRSYAHPGGVLIYRIEWQRRVVVYATDTEGYANVDRRLAKFAQGADLLIHDAQYSEMHYLGLAPGFPATQGWGHSTPSMACDTARAAGARRLALFHFEPRYDDAAVAAQEADACNQFPGAFAAREGLEIHLEAGSAGKSMMPSVPAPRVSRLRGHDAYVSV